MTISLSKGQKISLTKEQGLRKVMFGLGWDPAEQKGGFFGFGRKSGGDIDLDASALVFDANRRVIDTIWFRQLTGMQGAIRHSGDNRTGQGDGDDETISIDLAALPAQVSHIVITVNSFTGETFNQVENAFARLVDTSTGKEIGTYKLAEKGAHTGVVMAALSRDGDTWSMKAIGEPMRGRTVQDMVDTSARFL